MAPIGADVNLSPMEPSMRKPQHCVVELSKESWLVGGIIPGVDRQPFRKLKPD
jgi:transposase